MLQRWSDRLTNVPLLAGLAVMLAVAALQFANIALFDRLGLMVFDAYQRAEPREYQDAGVRIVDIDEESVARLGQWPWPRTEIARLTDRLAQAGAAAIAFDIVFSEADRTSPDKIAEQLALAQGDDGAALAATLSGLPRNDDVLADAFALSPVVSGMFLIEEERGGTLELPSGMAVLGSPPVLVEQYAGSVQPLPELRAASAGLGSLNKAGDTDGVVRKAPLVFRHDGQLVGSLSVEALRVAQGAGSVLVTTSDGSGETPGAPGAVVSLKIGDFEVPTTDKGELIGHFTPPAPERTIPAWKILSPDTPDGEIRAAAEGQIIFVGASATGLRDLVTTPLAEGEPGVMVHAQAAEQMILGQFLTRPDWARGLELFLVVLLGGVLALLLPKAGSLIGAGFAIAGIVLLGTGSWFAFDQWRFLLDPTYPMLALVMVYAVQTLLGFRQEERQRAYIRSAFDRYLSPEMVRQIAANPDRLELGGEEREMTVLFCDIRGFSRISEQYEPKQIIDFLTRFLTPMCDILLAHKATVDKFIGDAILAFWNAPLDDPDHYRNGARAALAMTKALDQLNTEMPRRSDQVWPDDVAIGIGLNAGLCCVGNMGSEQRLSYSLIGDTVNIASRLEGLTKQYGVKIIIGSALASELPGFALIELDRVKVVGREAPDTIYALVGDETFADAPSFVRLSAEHTAFLDHYRGQKWADALNQLERSRGEYRALGLGALNRIFAARIAQLQTAPKIPHWDGVYQAMQK